MIRGRALVFAAVRHTMIAGGRYSNSGFVIQPVPSARENAFYRKTPYIRHSYGTPGRTGLCERM